MADSGSALVDRRCKLTIYNPKDTPGDFGYETSDVIEIDGGSTDRGAVGMRIKFDIKKTLKKEPNTSTVMVTNLSPSRRSSLQKKGVRVILEAGYKDAGVSRIFSGDVRTIDHIVNGSDWDTEMHLGDGERSWKYARVKVSHAPGTRTADVLRSLVSAMGVAAGNLDSALSKVNSTMDHGYAASGSASVAVDKLVKSLRLRWSVQDGEFQLLDRDGHLEMPIPDISPTSGLIGSPEMGTPEKKGKPALIKIKSLLLPVRPGGRVNLKSREYDGQVTVQAVTLTGDTHGGEWYTEIVGVLSK